MVKKAEDIVIEIRNYYDGFTLEDCEAAALIRADREEVVEKIKTIFGKDNSPDKTLRLEEIFYTLDTLKAEIGRTL